MGGRFRGRHKMNGYIVSQNEKLEWYIECLACHLRSYNYNDIMMRYCGNCHAFHDDVAEIDAEKAKSP